MFSILVIVCLAIGTVVALGLGLKNMMLAGPGETAQKLMRLRVTLQGLALLVIMLVFWLSRSGGT